MGDVKRLVRILLCVTSVVLLVLAFVYMPRQRCERVSAVVHAQNGSLTLSPGDVEGLMAEAGIEVVGKVVKEVDPAAIAALLKANPYIASVNFIHFAGRSLVIDYTLREVVLHVFTPGGAHYFVDREGVVLPFTAKMQDYLMIVNGNVGDGQKVGARAPKGVREALALAKAILEDDFHRAQFSQIYLNGRGELELTSTVGGQTVLVGTADNAAEKLSNLRAVYENGLSHRGYSSYTSLDARFKNRIIATRQ